MLDIAIIIPDLKKYGGAERLLLECLVRWQHIHDLTVYSTSFNEELFAEVGLVRARMRQLTPRFEGEHATLLNATLLPKIWEREIGFHDIYHSHLWPTHLIDRHPMVWYAHEPLRQLYDLRYVHESEAASEEANPRLHFYPKETMDTVDADDFESILSTIQAFDQTGRPDRIVANSRSTARYLSETYGKAVEDVVYPGVSIEELELPTERSVVLTIGQLWPHKRMRLIIEAIAEVEDTQLYIVGSGPEKEKLERIAVNLGVHDRVFFLSGLDNHEVRILLARCLCVVFMPVREPFGIVALETLAAGKPLIAADEGGYVEVVDSKCASLVKPRLKLVADEIRRLKSNPEVTEAMGRHGREIAAQYTWDRTAAELLVKIEETWSGWVQQRKAPPRDAGPLFAVHYYLWYREGFGNQHWCDDPVSGWVTDRPDLGYYSSTDGDVLETHLAQIEGAGIDVVVLNLHLNENGIDPYQLEGAQRMMTIAANRNSALRFAVNLCLYTDSNDRIEQGMRRLRETLMRHDSYLVLQKRPVFMLFWTGVFDGDAEIIAHLRALTDDCLRVGVFHRPIHETLEPRWTQGLFDVISQFSPLELGHPENWIDIWQADYDRSAQTDKLPAVTISPCFDDRDLSDPNRARGIRHVPADGGTTYRRTMDFALAQTKPGFVFISTFNEFHENSHIEPTERNGRMFLDMTEEFIAKARKHWKVRGRRRKTGPRAEKSGA